MLPKIFLHSKKSLSFTSDRPDQTCRKSRTESAARMIGPAPYAGFFRSLSNTVGLYHPPVCGREHRGPQLFSAIILIDPSILPRRRLSWYTALRMIGLAGNRQLAQSARRRRNMFQGKSEALKRFTSGRGIFGSWSKEFVEAYLECGLLEKDAETAVLKCDPELEAQIFESVPQDVWRYAKQIACPVLAVRGEHSDVFTAESAGRLKGIISDCEVVTIADAGHFVPMGKPEKCSQVIIDYINRKFPDSTA